MTAHRRWWMPVVALRDFPAGAAGPVSVRLFSEELVLWRNEVGAAVAMADQCPHRGARLSLGCVRAGELQCAYHGWRFDAAGRCVAVPSLPGFTPPAQHAARCFAIREAHGLLWLAMDSPQGEPEGRFQAGEPPALEAMPERRVICGPFDVATSAPRVVENFLDTAHFAFVHAGWLGDANTPAVPHYQVHHDVVGRPSVNGYQAWQPRAQATSNAGAWVRYDYQVLSPYSACLLKSSDAAGAASEAYVLWTCPTDEESTRVWFTIATEDSQIEEAALIAFQEQIFAQDQPVLESQRPRRLPIGPASSERHVASDHLSVAYRRWLSTEGVAFGTC